MSIADTIQSIKNHTKEAYETAETKGATLPDEKNLANLSDTIAQLDKIDIVQETGDSETAVMSQKATTDAIDGIKVPIVYEYTAGSASPSILRVAASITDTVQLTLQYANKKTGAGGFNTVVLPLSSDTRGGIMSATDKSKLDSLLEIKSLNDSLSLDENGQLSVVGGGSDVNLLSAYTATVGDNDVYNAAYVNSRLNNTNINIGSQTQTADYANVAIGYLAKATNIQSAAFGSGSVTSREAEISFGNPNEVITSRRQRYLANVKAGELPTDAVNLQQMQDYVAEHAGSDYQLPAYVVGNTTELDPVAYTVTEDTVTANVARTNTATGTALNPALVTFPMATTTHAGAMSSADKTTLENLPNNYYTKTEIDAMIGDINEAIVKLDTGTGV